MAIGKYLSEGGERSSLRLNLLLATIAFIPAVLAIAFNIIWVTIKGQNPSWEAISLFVVACAGYFYQLWYAKKINKEAEGKPNGTGT